VIIRFQYASRPSGEKTGAQCRPKRPLTMPTAKGSGVAPGFFWPKYGPASAALAGYVGTFDLEQDATAFVR
jgi:hypothetical protein